MEPEDNYGTELSIDVSEAVEADATNTSVSEEQDGPDFKTYSSNDQDVLRGAQGNQADSQDHKGDLDVDTNVRFHDNSGVISVIVAGDIHLPRAEVKYLEFLRERERLKRCLKCFVSERAAFNWPCGCFSYCLGCPAVMNICTACHSQIESFIQCKLRPF